MSRLPRRVLQGWERKFSEMKLKELYRIFAMLWDEDWILRHKDIKNSKNTEMDLTNPYVSRSYGE